VIPWLQSESDPLPRTRLALSSETDAPGLLAAGGQLTPRRLEEAYTQGVFPWYSEGQPVLWWSPDPRMVLIVDEFKLSRSLRKAVARFVRSPGCAIRIDSAFRRVIEACAGTPRAGQDGTWIVPEMVDAYSSWHALGAMFYGESMFSRRTDASKIALAALVCFCREHDVPMIDCQQRTGHLASLGGRELARAEFESRLRRALAAPAIDEWSYDLKLWRHIGIDRHSSLDTGS
jgi:leucyl/phenylalanyl-tRNA--protein transferase